MLRVTELGKGENMWDRIIHSKPENCDNAEVACDSYHLYEEDVKMIKKIGVGMLIGLPIHLNENFD